MFRVITQSMPVSLKENKSPSADITLVWILNVAKGTGSGYRCVIDPGIVFQSCTVTNYHKSGGLRQQKLIPSQFWSPGVWNQGAGRDIQRPHPKTPGRILPCLFWFLGSADNPWAQVPISKHRPGNASLQSLPLASHGLPPCVPMCQFSSTRDTLQGLRIINTTSSVPTTSAKTWAPNTSIFTGAKDQDFHLSLCEHNPIHNRPQPSLYKY